MSDSGPQGPLVSYVNEEPGSTTGRKLRPACIADKPLLHVQSWDA